ncbi:MAG: leucine-rich repeat domain-containing protein [Clostridia bacterium]|nr:leucine-rich repeat domain-containing protein [Clostridia bacterium]
MADYRRERTNVVQDGFAFAVEHSAKDVPSPAAQPEPAARAPLTPLRNGPVVFEELQDGSLAAVQCTDKMLDDLNLEFEAGGRTVRHVGPRAFENCQNLMRVILPDTVQSIGEMAFAGCIRLHNISIPGSVQKVGTLAFARCSSLTRVRIEPGISALGPSCFQKCQRLVRVDIPSSVVSFGGGVFFGCSRQLTLYGAAGSKAEQYAKINGIQFDSENWKEDEKLILAENEDGTLTVCGMRNPDERRLEIPDELCGRSIVAIRENAFFGNPALEQVIIGRRIRQIGSNAFMGCRNLTLLSFDYGPERIDESAFAGCEQLRQVIFPGGTGSIGRLAFFGCRQLSFVRLPATTRLEALVFDGCAPNLRVYGGVRVEP